MRDITRFMGWLASGKDGDAPERAGRGSNRSAIGRANVVCLTYLLTRIVAAAGTGGASAPSEGDEVIVIYNAAMPASKAVADHYAQRRAVPTDQVYGFHLSTGAEMPRAEYRDVLLTPLVRNLTNAGLLKFGPVPLRDTNGAVVRTERRVTESKLRYAVLCYGVPWRIKPDTGLYEPEAEEYRPEMRRNEAAVDSELACLAVCERPYTLAGLISNPAYSATNAAALHLANGVLMVARLDGPTPEIARRLVDKALEAENDGMWGRAYFDLRGNVATNLAQGEEWLRNASEVCRRLGFETIVDTNEAVFSAGFPMSQIGFYAGWYRENACGPFALPNVEFMPGAFAYHLHSFSAANLRSDTQNWVGPFLAKGVTITMGSVQEPYIGGTPDLTIFASRLIFSKFSFGEAAYACQNGLSWQTTVVGDPLYRPFGRSPQELHNDLERRHSPLLAWSHLRLACMNQANGAPLADVVSLLEGVENVRGSAVLVEKLGDLYAAQGKPSSSTYMYRQALKLSPTPQQRVRLSFELADKLTRLGQNPEAYAVLKDFLNAAADYPDKPAVYRRLVALAEKLGQAEDVARFQSALAPEGVPSAAVTNQSK